MRTADRRRIERNAEAVRDWITVLERKIERSGQVPEEPLVNEHRGGSNTPVAPALLDLSARNAEATKHIQPIHKSALKSTGQIRGHKKSEMLQDIRSSPGCETNWSASKREAFTALCQLMAYRVWTNEPDLELRIYLSPNAPDSKEYIEGEGERRTQPSRRAQRIDTEESYRRIVARIEALEEGGKVSREEAKEWIRYDLDCGKTRIEDALAFVKRERRGVA